jgi:hypothetical protein
MDFWIQASNPAVTGEFDPDDENLEEALETVFPLTTEVALLSWNYVVVPLDYKYDLSLMSLDLLAMLDRLQESDSGTYTNPWVSNGFRCDWTLTWAGPELSITADWQSVGRGLERELRAAGELTLPVAQFRREWKAVLGRFSSALAAGGYRTDRIQGMADLARVHDGIDHPGALYHPALSPL